jgi:hypothetical protein
MQRTHVLQKVGGIALCVLCCAQLVCLAMMAGMASNPNSPQEYLAEKGEYSIQSAASTPLPMMNTSLGSYRYTGDALNASFSELLSDFTTKELHEAQFLTIAATFWYVKAMQILDPVLLATQAEAIADFVMSCYDATQRRFIENRPYAPVGDGAMLIRSHSTPLNTHLMAIWILGELQLLTIRINSATIDKWKIDLAQAINSDGGFGEIFENNSTIVETYYAAHALLAIFGGNPTNLPGIRYSLINYLMTRSRTIAWGSTLGIGGFSEYSTEFALLGWEDYLANYFASEIYRLFQITPNSFIQNQTAYFMVNSKVYSTLHYLFYGQHNDFWFENSQNAKTYYGASILLNFIKNLNVTHHYNELLVLNNFESAWNVSKGLYMLTNRTTGFFDLPYQALIAQMLDRYNLLPTQRKAAMAAALQNYYAGGGVSFEETTDYSIYTAHHIGGIANGSAEIINEVFTLMTRYIDQDHFIGKKVMSSLDFLIFDKGNTLLNYPIKMTALATETLRRTDSFYRFMNLVDMSYNYYEVWVHTQLLPSGHFRNSTTADTGDLDSTYYGVVAQANYLDHNFGRTWATYYSAAELDSIQSALLSYAISVNGSWGAWHEPNPLDATYKLQLALDKIGRSASYNRTELHAFITYWINRQSTLSDTQMLELSRLLAYNMESSPELLASYLPRHDWIASLLSRSASENIRLPVLPELFALKPYAVGMDVAPTLQHSVFYTIQIAGLGLISLVSLTDLVFVEIPLNWSTTDFRYTVQFQALINPTHPFQFTGTVQFRAKGLFYECSFSRPLEFPYTICTTITDGNYLVQIDLVTPSAIHEAATVQLRINGTQHPLSADIFQRLPDTTVLSLKFGFPSTWTNTTAEIRIISSIVGIEDIVVPLTLNRTAPGPDPTTTTTSSTNTTTSTTNTTTSQTTTETTSNSTYTPDPRDRFKFPPTLIIQFLSGCIGLAGGVVLFKGPPRPSKEAK